MSLICKIQEWRLSVQPSPVAERHQSQPAWAVGGAEKEAITSLLASILRGTDWLQKS